jgi:DHA2 family multidrug resistance protein
MTRYSLDIDKFWLIWPAMLQGLGMGFVFVPLSAIAYITLPREKVPEAAGLYSLMRTIGSAIGISLVTTMLSRLSQVSWQELGGNVNLYNPAFSHYLDALGRAPTDPQTLALIASQIARQAEVIAMLDLFKITAWSFVVMLPLALLLKRGNRMRAPAVAAE